MFLTLNEYLLGAQKILNLYGFKCHKDDEDAISYVASYMMKADETWDGHSSSRNTWRFTYARYAIMKLKTKKRKERKLVSLHRPLKSDNGKEKYLCDIIPNKPKCNLNFNEMWDAISPVVTQKQFQCLRMYYQDQLTMREIGDKLGVTKQQVSLNIIAAIKRIKDVYKCVDDNFVNRL